MAVMFDPNIPGGFPSGYGGASGVETGASGGAGLGLAMAAAPVIASITGEDPTGFSQLMGALGLGKMKQSTIDRNVAAGTISDFFKKFGIKDEFNVFGPNEENRGFANKIATIGRQTLGRSLKISDLEPLIPIMEQVIKKAEEDFRVGTTDVSGQLKDTSKLTGKALYLAEQENRRIKEEAEKSYEDKVRGQTSKGLYFAEKSFRQGLENRLKDAARKELFEELPSLLRGQPFREQIPDATFTGEDPRLTDAGQYTPEMPTVQGPEPSTEPGLITEPEPTPVETPTEPPTETPSDQGLFSDEAIAQFFTDEEQKAIVSNLEKAKAADADADATLSDKNNAWGKVAFGLAAGAGLYGLSRLFRSDNGETTDGDINNLPRLNLNLPSSNRLGLNFSNTGGLTPVEPTRLAELPTGVQSVRGMPLGKFEYKDDYVRYPTGYPLL